MTVHSNKKLTQGSCLKIDCNTHLQKKNKINKNDQHRKYTLSYQIILSMARGIHDYTINVDTFRKVLSFQS